MTLRPTYVEIWSCQALLDFSYFSNDTYISVMIHSMSLKLSIIHQMISSDHWRRQQVTVAEIQAMLSLMSECRIFVPWHDTNLIQYT